MYNGQIPNRTDIENLASNIINNDIEYITVSDRLREDFSPAWIFSIRSTYIRYDDNFQEFTRLPSRFIANPSNETLEKVKEYCETNNIEYHQRAHELDELYHYIDDFNILSISGEELKRTIIARVKHPLIVYSAITILLVNKYTELYGIHPTKELLKHSCANWQANCKYPVKFWRTYYQNRGSYISPMMLFPFDSFTQTIQNWIDNQTDDDDDEAEESPTYFLKDYSERATNHFTFKYGKTPAYSIALGVELELEHLTETAKNILKETLSHHAIFKRDGSVANGVEICTAPATLDLHKEAFKPFFEKEHGLLALPNCGLHVHVDKKTLHKTQIAKILMFMNHAENNSFIENIAGRKANNYCQVKGYSWETAAYQQAGDRYSRVNLNPSSTIEFRLFASTTNYSQFSRCLEFVQAVIDYTKTGEHNCTIKDVIKQENFLAYLKTHRQFYPELYKFTNPKETK